MLVVLVLIMQGNSFCVSPGRLICLPFQVSIFCVSYEEQIFNDVPLYSHQNGSRPPLETESKHLPVLMSPNKLSRASLLDIAAF